MAEAEGTLQSLTEDDRRALRGSKFAPLPAPPQPSFRPQARLAHPGGPMTTNKAAALAKFLERKLQQPDGLNSLDPTLVELAVKNAKETVTASKGSSSTQERRVRHVTSFEDSSEECEEVDEAAEKQKKRKKKKQKYEEIDNSEKKQKKKKRKKKMTKTKKGSSDCKKKKQKL